jgi:HD-GYP domain-containing protein (c-di-GMP phosphodiesterase class II)
MTNSRHKSDPRHDPAATPAANDPVLAALHRAEECYREMYVSVEHQHADLAREVAQARHDNQALSAQLAARERELDDVRRGMQHERETTQTLAAALKEIHRAIFSGSVYELVLRACLTLTGATRGLYATTNGEDEALRIRAAVDIGDYPSAAPSDFITSLCRAALESDRVTACDEVRSSRDRRRQSESFRNCLVAPVVLQGNRGGVVLVADKTTGDFTDDDAGVLLSVGSHTAVAIENAQLQREVQDAYLSIVSVLAHTMAARAYHDGQLEEEVCRLAGAIAERMGLPEYERSVVYYAALLHDVGNVGVSDGVLNKPGPLLDAERDLIRAHTQIGHDLVREVPILEAVAGIVRHHHERYDGTGYPDGLEGESIPIAARIVAVVDAFGAMLALRSYRPAVTRERACEQIREGAGTQFDPRVVEAFLTVIEEGLAAKSLERSGVALPGLDLHVLPTGVGSR